MDISRSCTWTNVLATKEGMLPRQCSITFPQTVLQESIFRLPTIRRCLKKNKTKKQRKKKQNKINHRSSQSNKNIFKSLTVKERKRLNQKDNNTNLLALVNATLVRLIKKTKRKQRREKKISDKGNENKRK